MQLGRKNFVQNNGSIDLPITGTFETLDYSEDYDSVIFSIAFYNASGVLVKPSAGTITVRVQDSLGVWHNPSIGSSSVSASAVDPAAATFTKPSWIMDSVKGKITLSGVTGTGIAYCRALFRGK